MSTDFTVNPDGMGQAEKALNEEGHAFNDIRNAVPAEPADAGASTTILNLVVSHLFTAATALLDDRATTVSTMADCRDNYLRTEDTATCGLERIMHAGLTPHRGPCPHLRRGRCRSQRLGPHPSTAPTPPTEHHEPQRHYRTTRLTGKGSPWLCIR